MCESHLSFPTQEQPGPPQGPTSHSLGQLDLCKAYRACPHPQVRMLSESDALQVWVGAWNWSPPCRNFTFKKLCIRYFCRVESSVTSDVA